MRKLTIVLFIILNLCGLSVYTQVTQQWVQRYNGINQNDDESNAITTDIFGNVYVTGISDYDYVTIKYSSTGEQLWLQRYNGTANSYDEATSIAVDGNGNVYITGSCSEAESLSDDLVTIKYNSAGVIQWVQKYDVSKWDRPDKLIIDNLGNLYVFGNTQDFPTRHFWGIIIKYNTLGVRQWVNTYEGGLSSAIIDNAGYIYAAGSAQSPNPPYGFTCIKYNSAGVLQWLQRYDESDKREVASSIALDNAGNIYMTGAISGAGTNSFDYITVKYNSAATMQWVQKYNGTLNGYDWANSVKVDTSGNVYVTGSSVELGTFQDITTIKYNRDGVQKWIRKYNGPGNQDWGGILILDQNGNVYVGGNSNQGVFSGDYVIIRYDSLGTLQWAETYNSTGNNDDRIRAFSVDDFKNVYVTGMSAGADSTYNYCTVKYQANILPPQIGVPVLSTPLNNSFDMPLTVVLDWNNVQGSIVTYDVQVAADPRFPSTVVNQTGLSNSQYIIPFSSHNQILQPNTQYFWRARARSSLGTGAWSEVWNFTTGTGESSPNGLTQIGTEIPKEYKLYNNYPNPFNPSTNIKFDIPNDAEVNIIVYDMLGREVQILANEFKNAGSYEVSFNASALSSGMYFYELTAGRFTDIKKMVLVK